jgi:thiamine transport system substrate-binding protein
MKTLESPLASPARAGTCAVVVALAASLLTSTALAQQPVLTIYTYDSFAADWGPGPAVEEAFEAVCSCDLQWIAVADGVALLNRLRLEGAGTQADIVLGLDTNLIAEARDTGLFAPHQTDLAELDLPIEWNDDLFVPFDYGYFAVMYDSEVVSDPPASLRELVEGDPTEKIVIQDPRTSTPGLGLLLWMKSVYGDEAQQAWEQLSERVLTVSPGWSESYGLFTSGEVPMVLSYTTSEAYHRIAEDSDRYKAAAFEDGHYLQVEVAGIVGSTDQPELARQFMAFMTGPEFQDTIPTSNWMMPVAATSEPLPDAFETLVEPAEVLLFPPEEVAENRRAWIDEWLAAMSR